MQSQIRDLVIHVYGHESAVPHLVAHAFSGSFREEISPEADLAIFSIDPSAGVDQKTIEQWRELDEYQIPRLVVVVGLEKQEADFDDAVMIANRVFDQMATPFLVLHDDAGLPIALIDLEDLTILNYSQTPPLRTTSEEEHQTLVQEFREEYLELFSSLGKDSFNAGLLFPAIPLWIEKGIGVDIVRKYISEISS